MLKRININQCLTAGRVVFKDGSEIESINFYITDGFLIIEDGDAGTFYNLDEIKKMENVTLYRNAKPAPAGGIW